MSRTPAPLKRLPLGRSLFQGLSWIGGLSVLSGVMSQTSASTAKELIIPESAPAVVRAAPPVESSAPPPVTTRSIAAPELLSPTPISTPIAPPESLSVAAPGPTRQSEDHYEEPLSIVLSERSSGCQNQLQLGHSISDGPCGAPKPLPALVLQVAETVAGVNGLVNGSTGERPVAIDSVSLESVLSTTASVRDYYNRTVRPPNRLGNGNIQLIFPLAIPAAITSAFGWRVHPISGDRRLHSGTDLGAAQGTPVLAAYAGQVAIADFLGGYGLAVMLEHNKNTQQTLYAHLSEIFVKPGAVVKQGDVIGRVGTTGNSTGPHLHFEFRQLTPDGWTAMDAGMQLESSLAQLVKALETMAQRSSNRT